MTEPAPSALGPEARLSWGDDLRGAGPAAVRAGALVALVALVIGQLVPLVINLAGGGLAVATQVRLGWLYTAAANAVPISVGEFSVQGGQLVRSGTLSLSIALLSLTAVLIWALYLAGSVAAKRVSDVPVRRLVAGSLVAPGYAIPLAILGLVVELRLDTGGGFFPDVSSFSAATPAIIVMPMGLSVVAGACGGLSTSAWFRADGGAVLAGAWRMFVWALGLSLAGLLLFAAVRPSGLEGYARQLTSLSPRTAVTVVGHQGLLVPNQAVMLLAVAMGECVSVSNADQALDVLCLDRQPGGENPLDWLSGGLSSPPRLPTRSMPPTALLVVLAPLAAIAIGAKRASSGARSLRSALARAVGAGALFALLVAIAIRAATIALTSVQERAGVVLADPGSLAVGAGALRAGAFAFVWGTGVGAVVALGMWAFERRRAPGEPDDQTSAITPT